MTQFLGQNEAQAPNLGIALNQFLSTVKFQINISATFEPRGGRSQGPSEYSGGGGGGRAILTPSPYIYIVLLPPSSPILYQKVPVAIAIEILLPW